MLRALSITWRRQTRKMGLGPFLMVIAVLFLAILALEWMRMERSETISMMETQLYVCQQHAECKRFKQQIDGLERNIRNLEDKHSEKDEHVGTLQRTIARKTTAEQYKIAELEGLVEKEWELRKMLRGAYTLQRKKLKDCEATLSHSAELAENLRSIHIMEHKKVSGAHQDNQFELDELRKSEENTNKLLQEAMDVIKDLEKTLMGTIKSKNAKELESAQLREQIDHHKEMLHQHMLMEHTDLEEELRAIKNMQSHLSREERDVVEQMQDAYEVRIALLKSENDNLREESESLRRRCAL